MTTRRPIGARGLAAAALIVGLLGRGTAWGFPDTSEPLPGGGLILTLEGAIEPTAEASKRAGAFTVMSFNFVDDRTGATRWLAVTDARTVEPENGVAGKDLFDVLAASEPELLVAGPPDLVASMRDAVPGTALRVEGLVDPSSRLYYLLSVVRTGTSC